MDVRENLVEQLLWWSNECDRTNFGCQASKLLVAAANYIANGVTVQEWAPVDDRLPENGGYVVCIAKRNPFSRFMPMVARIEKNGWVNPITEQYISEVTHWMPMPSTEGIEDDT